MQIRVFAKPNAQSDSVEKLLDGSYQVRIKAKPSDGEANKRLVKIMAAYFGVSLSSVQVVKGHTSRYKIVEIKNL